MSNRFKYHKCKYQNCITDTKTGKKYDFSPNFHAYDINMITKILNDVIE